MLHKPTIPDCQPALEWIVQLQADFVNALCRDTVSPAQVTEDWCVRLRPDADPEWLRSFVQTTLKGASTLSLMQTLAGLEADTKRKVREMVADHRRFPRLLDGSGEPPPRMRPLDELGSPPAQSALAGFLERFYDPWLYRATGIPASSTGATTRAGLVERYRAVNDELLVCPVCDGHQDYEVDHFYPKAHYPALSCHPLNLVPVCVGCNRRTNKGEKKPLDLAGAHPASRWFHPYLDAGRREVDVQISQGCVSVGATDVALHAQLRNLDWLVNLQQRWSQEYRNVHQAALRKVRGAIRRGYGATPGGLDAKLREWADEAVDTRGVEPYSFLAEAYFRRALQAGTEVHEELTTYADNTRRSAGSRPACG